MTYPCPKGHPSTESDFCSECGAKILGGASIGTVPPPPMTAASGLQSCPDCTTPHDAPDGKFCEICGYNFETRQSAPVEIPPLEIPPLDPDLLPPPVPSSLSSASHAPGTVSPETPPHTPTIWKIRIEIDPTLAAPESPPAPTQAPIDLTLSSSVNLIGRHNTAKAIVPEIPLDFDDAVSSRHALLTVQPDGQLILRDIGSSNGTMIDGVEVKPMQDYPLVNGNSFTLGHWTRITAIGN